MPIIIKDDRDKILAALDSMSVKSGNDSVFRPIKLNVSGDKIEVEEVDKQLVCFVRATWRPKSVSADGLTEAIIDPVLLHNAIESRPPGEIVVEINPPFCTVSSPGSGRVRVRLEGLEPVAKPGSIPAFSNFTHVVSTTGEAISSLFDRASKPFSDQSKVPRVVLDVDVERATVKVGSVEEDGADVEDPIPGGVKVLGEKQKVISAFGGQLLRSLAGAATGALKVHVGDKYPVCLEFETETLSIRYYLSPQATET